MALKSKRPKSTPKRAPNGKVKPKRSPRRIPKPALPSTVPTEAFPTVEVPFGVPVVPTT